MDLFILKQLLIYLLGSLVALKDEEISFDELFSTFLKPSLLDLVDSKVEKSSYSQKFKVLFEEILLIEDIYEMIPDKYDDNLDLFIKKVKKLLKEIETNSNYGSTPSLIVQGLKSI